LVKTISNFSYSHVDEFVEMDSIFTGRHKIEFYVTVLIKWFHVSRWSHVTVIDGLERDVSSETDFDDHSRFKEWLKCNLESFR